MAHLVETMAYRNATPWHGLGNRLSENQPLEVWLREAGMEWNILNAPVQYDAGAALHEFTDHKVLYRSDSLQPLSVVSNRYQVVQPREVVEFYKRCGFTPTHFESGAFGRDAWFEMKL
jgi:phage/plasmid-like protein (TIGR03299 family)